VTKSEQTVDSDSDSDVIIESEEIIDLTGDSQSINSKTGEQHNIDQSSNDLPICDNQGNVSGLSGKVENLSNRLENVAIDSYSHKKDNFSLSSVVNKFLTTELPSCNTSCRVEYFF
jgi:hypothetical protein